jgi:tetratricopeptide (TPR) repeat protein
LNPRDAGVHFALGGVYETRGRLDLAMKEYKEALEADRNFAPAETAIGWMLFNKDQIHEAMDCFNRALRSNPEDARAYLGIARVYSRRGKQQMAMENYAQAIKLEKDPEQKSRIMNDLFREGNTWDV